MSEQVNNSENRKKNILVVEDDDINLSVITAFLSKEYNIDSATNGLEAIEKATSKKYDAILMDINLGSGITGIEVTQKLRNTPEYANTPIIAITAFAMDGDKEEFLAGGCSDYISKPFTRQEILSLMKRTFEKT
ncbi:MAG: response regulator [Ignavibacterium sp.]|nr:response regulator [Ignavibacterium sp.]MCX7612504.1 response regulator [Ignavibacterium sp.]MDW8374450.1 response regulator [Ignavibacteriales bacterium]